MTGTHRAPPSPDRLASWVRDARQRTFDLVADLDDGQLIGPRLSIVNPMLWEIGHLAWFQEKWVLRRAGDRPPLIENADALYDSMAIPHDTRWELPLPSRARTLRYLREVRDAVLEALGGRGPAEETIYFILLTVFHEDMHDEAFTYTRQTLGYPPPGLSGSAPPPPDRPGAGAEGDAEIPGGRFELGAAREEPFVFDNEKWAHAVEVAPFAIARRAVSQKEFAAFADDGGYRRRELWSEAGWAWREREGAEAPVYWRRDGAGWQRRHFDRWVPLEPEIAVIHVNRHEAEAWCRWAGRRLPTEAEWEMAAAAEPGAAGGLAAGKRRFPWAPAGSSLDGPEEAARRANLDGHALGCRSVAEHAAGDSAFGCRQMTGNVWEWTASPFLPYPGFVPDPYKEYSEPWFRTHDVLRGGCWATRSRLLRNTWRNFYEPDRRDVFAGFRTCAASR